MWNLFKKKKCKANVTFIMGELDAINIHSWVEEQLKRIKGELPENIVASAYMTIKFDNGSLTLCMEDNEHHLNKANKGE